MKSIQLFTDVPVEEHTLPTESLCSSSSLPPPTPDNTSTTTSPKAPEIIAEKLLLEVQEAVEEETGSSECLMTEEPTRVSPSSQSLLEAAADVASSLEDAVDAVIQSSPRARRRKLELLDNNPVSVLQNNCFSRSSNSSTWSLHNSDSNGKLYSDWNPNKPVSPIFDQRNKFSCSVEHSSGESWIETHHDEERKEETWDENCRQHLADFAEKLSEKLLEEIDQYQKQTSQKPPLHNETHNVLEHLDDPYLSRLNEELQDLTKLSKELQERNSYLANLNNSTTILEEIQPPSILIRDPLKITVTQNPLLETPVELNFNSVALDMCKNIEKEPKRNGALTISSESTDDLSSANEVVLAFNSCSRQTSDDTTEDLDTCVEVLGKGDNSELKEDEIPQEVCDETVSIDLATEEDSALTVPEQCDTEQSQLLSSIAGSVISLRAGYSMESSDAEQTATSGSECSRRDKTASTLSLGPNSIELSDAVTGSSSDCSRDMRCADRTAQCDGRSSSEEAPPRRVAPKAETQEPPEILTKTQSCASSLSGSTSQESLPSDNGGGAITFHRYYHVFREGELDQLIERYVENLHIISSYYDHANWCVVAEKVHVWTI